MKKKQAIAFLLSTTMTVGGSIPVFAATNDISGHWAEVTIAKWQNEGKIGGYEDGTFKPDRTITRAEFVRLLNTTSTNAFISSADINFSDVKSSDWFFADVSKAASKKIVNGFEDGTFRPSETVTRVQAAVFVCNAKGLVSNELAANTFIDVAEIPAWAKGAVGAAVSAGYLSGYPDGSFGANKGMTRAEAVSTLDRLSGGSTIPAPLNQGVNTTYDDDTKTGANANNGEMVWTSGGSTSKRKSSSSGSSSSNSSSKYNNISITSQDDANKYKGTTLKGTTKIYTSENLEFDDVTFENVEVYVENIVGASYIGDNSKNTAVLAANSSAEIVITFNGKTVVTGNININKNDVAEKVVIQVNTSSTVKNVVRGLFAKVATVIRGSGIVENVTAEAPVSIEEGANVSTVEAKDNASVVVDQNSNVDTINATGEVKEIVLEGNSSNPAQINVSGEAKVESIEVVKDAEANVALIGSAEVKQVTVSDSAAANVTATDTAKVETIVANDNATTKVEASDNATVKTVEVKGDASTTIIASGENAKVENVELSDNATGSIEVNKGATVDTITTTSTGTTEIKSDDNSTVGKIEAVDESTVKKDENIEIPVEIITTPTTPPSDDNTGGNQGGSTQQPSTTNKITITSDEYSEEKKIVKPNGSLSFEATGFTKPVYTVTVDGVELTAEATEQKGVILRTEGTSLALNNATNGTKIKIVATEEDSTSKTAEIEITVEAEEIQTITLDTTDTEIDLPVGASKTITIEKIENQYGDSINLSDTGLEWTITTGDDDAEYICIDGIDATVPAKNAPSFTIKNEGYKEETPTTVKAKITAGKAEKTVIFHISSTPAEVKAVELTAEPTEMILDGTGEQTVNITAKALTAEIGGSELEAENANITWNVTVDNAPTTECTLNDTTIEGVKTLAITGFGDLKGKNTKTVVVTAIYTPENGSAITKSVEIIVKAQPMPSRLSPKIAVNNDETTEIPEVIIGAKTDLYTYIYDQYGDSTSGKINWSVEPADAGEFSNIQDAVGTLVPHATFVAKKAGKAKIIAKLDGTEMKTEKEIQINAKQEGVELGNIEVTSSYPETLVENNGGTTGLQVTATGLTSADDAEIIYWKVEKGTVDLDSDTGFMADPLGNPSTISTTTTSPITEDSYGVFYTGTILKVSPSQKAGDLIVTASYGNGENAPSKQYIVKIYSSKDISDSITEKAHSMIPQDDQKNVALDAEVSIEFLQEGLTLDEIQKDKINIGSSSDTEVTGISASFDENNPKKLIIAHHDFEPSTTYNVRIPKGAIRNGIATNSNDFWWSFRTVEQPTVKYDTMLPNGNVVGINEEVSVTFNEDVSFNEKVTEKIKITTTGENDEVIEIGNVEANFAEDNRKLIITHDAFELGKTYTVTIPKGAITNGIAATKNEITWSFTTELTQTTLNVVSLSPENGATNVPIDKYNDETNIHIEFEAFFNIMTKGVDQISIMADDGTVLEGISATYTTLNGREFNVYHETALQPNTTYTITIPKGTVKHTKGAAVNEEISWTFTTGNGEETDTNTTKGREGTVTNITESEKETGIDTEPTETPTEETTLPVKKDVTLDES